VTLKTELARRNARSVALAQEKTRQELELESTAGKNTGLQIKWQYPSRM